MAMSLDKSENKVQIDHLHKAISYGENITEIDASFPEIFD